MKVLITGHKRGIGKALAECFAKHDHTVIGFSKSDGYDITDVEVQREILTEAESCDIFINNAYAPDAQHQLLVSICELYQGTDKTIVHVGSKLIDLKEPAVSSLKNGKLLYYQNKIRSQEYLNNFSRSHKLQVLNLVLGWVDTDLAKNSSATKMEPDKVADFVYTILSERDNFFVEEIRIVK